MAFLVGKILSDWVVKHSLIITGQKMTASMRVPWIALMSFLDNTIAMAKMMTIRMMTNPGGILCAYTGWWEISGKVSPILFPPEDFCQQEISGLLGKSIIVQGLAFLPPRDFCFILTRTLKQLLTTEAQICNFICNKRLSEGEFSRDDPYRDHWDETSQIIMHQRN